MRFVLLEIAVSSVESPDTSPISVNEDHRLAQRVVAVARFLNLKNSTDTCEHV